MNKVPCKRCSAMILPATASRTGGVCMPCARPRARVRRYDGIRIASILSTPGWPEFVRQPWARLTMAQYRDLLEGVQLPTQAQRENFVDYVAQAHSWYKGLPLCLPGAKFYFFIDKYAGCDRVVLQDGTTTTRERITHGTHYSYLPTIKHRRKFGQLAFSCGERAAAASPTEGWVAAVPGDDGRMYCLPTEILDAGRVRLTAVIHPNSPRFDFWDWRGPSRYRREWPHESGGEAALEDIFNRCREIRDSGFRCRMDPVLRRLFQPERQRQRAEMLRAIDQVCRVIEAARELG